MLTAHFPFGAVLLDTRSYTPEILSLVEERVRHDCAEGYLYVERDNAAEWLLFHGGQAFLAARLDESRFRQIRIQDFFQEFSKSGTVRLRLCSTDLGLTLLMGVVFQHEPSLRIPSSLTDADQVLRDLEAKGEDAALVIAHGEHRHLTFCRLGKPVAAYFADPALRPSEPSAKEQVLVYCYNAGTEPAPTIEVYHHLSIKKDENSGHAFRDYIEGRLGPPPFLLTLRRSTGVLERRLFQDGKATIGRGPANDIVIDHLSVSRKHCEIAWGGKAYQITDAGSFNGTFVNKKKVAGPTPLEIGDRIRVGEFDVTFGDEMQNTEQSEVRTVFLEKDPNAGVGSGPKVPQLLYDGSTIKIESTVFTIGASPKANLKISGWFLQPIQATIVSEAGTYRLLPMPKGRSVSVDGKDVEAAGVLLANGARIKIGGATLLFVIPS